MYEQARPSDQLFFLVRFAFAWLRHRPAARACGCAYEGKITASVFKPVHGGWIVPTRNFIGTGSRHCPQRQSQGLPCGFAKQTKKNGEDHGNERARFPEIFRSFLQTAASITQPTSNQTQVFCFSFDSKEKRPPLFFHLLIHSTRPGTAGNS